MPKLFISTSMDLLLVGGSTGKDFSSMDCESRILLGYPR